MISKCNELSQNRNIPASELNRSNKYINKVQVDGCYIRSGAKCDWLFEILEDDVVLCRATYHMP
jgi:hypothetical protein